MGKETQIALGVIGVLVLLVCVVVVTRISGLSPQPDVSIEAVSDEETETPAPKRVTSPPTIVQPSPSIENLMPAEGANQYEPYDSDPTWSGSSIDRGPDAAERTYLPLRQSPQARRRGDPRR